MLAPPAEPPERAYVQAKIDQLAKVYRNAQERIRRQLLDATLGDFKRFQFGQQMRQIQAIIAALNAEARLISKTGVPEAYKQGKGITAAALERQGKSLAGAKGGQIHAAAVEAVVDQMSLDLLQANASIETNSRRILRASQQQLIEERQINQLISRGVVEGEARKQTSEKLAKKLRAQLQDERFVTVNGRDYTPEYYASLVARTRTREAVTEGAINSAVEYGIDLFQVSVHDSSCPQCLQYQGKVYSLSGTDPRFPKLDARPPFHPHCEHVLLPVVEEALDPGELDSLAALSNSARQVDGERQYQLALEGKAQEPVQGETVFKKARREAERFESTIRDLTTHERAAAWSVRGEKVFEKDGTKSEVMFTPSEVEAMRGGLVTHNHPNGGSFSTADIRLAAELNLKEVRAVGRDFTYVARPLESGWDAERIRHEIEMAYKHEFSKEYRSYVERIQKGEITSSEANKEHGDKVLRALAEKFGFGYTRSEREKK